MTQPTIQSKQVQHHCSGFGIYIYYIYIDGICTVYTGIRAVYAGIRWCALVYAWYTRGIRVVYARLLWYTRGIRAVYARLLWYTVVYARYTLGICVVYAWYTLVYAHDPPSPKTVRTASGDDRLR